MINRDLIEIFIELAREKNIERSELGTIIEQLFFWSLLMLIIQYIMNFLKKFMDTY